MATDTFDPTDYFSTGYGGALEPMDYSTFAPNYTTDPTESAARLQMLQDALAYVQQQNPENADYLTQQLQADIAEQQNIGGYDQAYTNLNGSDTQQSLAQQLATDSGLSSGLQNKFYPNNVETSGATLPNMLAYVKTLSPDAYNYLANDYGLSQYTTESPYNTIYSGGSALSAVQAGLKQYMAAQQDSTNPDSLVSKIANAKTALNTAQSSVLNNLTIGGPDYGTAQKQLQDYYNNTAIPAATATADANIYQQNHDIRNNINQTMMSAGLSSSGVRQKALADQNSQAITQAANAVADAGNQATQQENAFNQTVKQQQADAASQLGNLKSSDISSILGGAGNSLINSFGQQQNAQETQNMNQAETGLNAAQSNNYNVSNILGNMGGAAGSILGNPYISPLQNGALV